MATANAEFARLPLARDHEDARRLLKKDYGLAKEHIPENWRVFEHPRLGAGIVYQGFDAEEQPSFKFKSLERDTHGKRNMRFLFGKTGTLTLGEPGGPGLVVAGGEEKCAVAAAAGYEAITRLDGEKPLDKKMLDLILAGERPARIILANDHDEAGAKANRASAEAFELAGYPAAQIRIVEWPPDANSGFDLNDLAKSDGTEAVRAALEGAPAYEPKIPPLDVWDIDRVFGYEPPENDKFVGDFLISAGQLALLIGPPDIGKSRLAVQLAFELLLGKAKWLGTISIHRSDLKVLIIQTENNPRRVKADFASQLRGCSPSQREMVNRCLRIHIPRTVEDSALGLDDEVNVERLKKTIRAFDPDLVIFDPYGDFFAGENENDAMQTRKTIKKLMEVAQSHNPDTAVLLVHHARSGKAAAAGAEGWERGAFGRGSKALLSIARSQINVIPGDKDGDAVIIACGKNNNGRRFERFAVRLDDQSMRYRPDPDFDFEQWESEVNNRKAGSNKKVTPEIVKMALESLGGSKMKRKLVEKIREVTQCSSTVAYDNIKKMIEKEELFETAGSICLLPAKKPV